MTGASRDYLLWLAAKERGSSETEELLPFEIQLLLVEIRRYAHAMPPTFIQHLRTTVRGIAE